MNQPIEITIDSEAVEREVVAAIVDGAIGEHITKAVNDSLKPERFGGKSLIDRAIEVEIERAVKTTVLQRLQAEPAATQIRDAIDAQLTDDVVLTVTSRAVQRMLDLPE